MALTPSCVNSGGDRSIIRLDRVPALEEECPLGDHGFAALRCWQARPGEIMTVLDPELAAYRARITCLNEGSATCVPFEKLAVPVESPIRIDVYQALPDKERFELVMQKLTEIGVTRIMPMESRHSVTLLERDTAQKKSHRWPEVIRRAAKQCRRAMLPELMPTSTFAEVLGVTVNTELRLMLYEGDAPWTLREAIGALRPQSVALLVGPEGGFAEEEVEMARDAGFLPISLGGRILRTETAAIVAAALVQSHLGDLG